VNTTSSHHSWNQSEPQHTYTVPHGQLLQEQSISPPNLTPNREFVDPLVMLDQVRILPRRDPEFHAPSPPPAAFEYRANYSHSNQNLHSEYQYFGIDSFQSGAMVPGIEHQGQYL
jgi:hypothetical protein